MEGNSFARYTEIYNSYFIAEKQKELKKLMEENKDVLIRLKNDTPKPFGHIHCPVNGWDCPYYDANGCCTMYPDADPKEECDDFYYFWSNDDDDYICYDEH